MLLYKQWRTDAMYELVWAFIIINDDRYHGCKLKALFLMNVLIENDTSKKEFKHEGFSA